MTHVQTPFQLIYNTQHAVKEAWAVVEEGEDRTNSKNQALVHTHIFVLVLCLVLVVLKLFPSSIISWATFPTGLKTPSLTFYSSSRSLWPFKEAMQQLYWVCALCYNNNNYYYYYYYYYYYCCEQSEPPSDINVSPCWFIYTLQYGND